MTSHYDIAVIGGGIHGVGVAQAAAAAGHSVVVLEKPALAAGTSSRSSKLIHGGLRYLESGRLRLVRESLRERAILLRIAPELVKLVPFYIPVYATTRRRPWMIGAGLAVYAVLGGLAPANRFAHLPRGQWSQLDGLDTRDLESVFRYHDAQTDDAALTRAVMYSAQSLGAELKLPAEFVGARRVPAGWNVDYLDGATPCTCTASAIVNAAGPWANHVLACITPTPPAFAIELMQGTHLVLEAPVTQGIYYVEAQDRRAVFVMPWHGRTLVGTTETPFSGDPACVAPTPLEIEYLLQTYRRHFPHRQTQIVESFAGLRVLPANNGAPFLRSRETVFHPDDPQRPRLITIYGGKLTGYRLSAARALTGLRGALPERTRRADTATLALTRAD